MKNFGRLVLGFLLALTFRQNATVVAAVPPPAAGVADPIALQRWQSNRFGMFIHYDPSCLTGEEISWSRAGERRDRHERVTEGTPAAEYDALYRQFNPSDFDAQAWTRLMIDSGMKYVVFTAKHHDGFAMFDSKLTDYKITESPFKRDLCAELARACHEKGISLGFYYSPPDWHHPDFFTADHARYLAYFHGQVRELLSNYGPVDVLWFDTDGGDNTPEIWGNEDLFPMIRQLQPQILLTKRCGGWGDFDTPEQRIGKFQNTAPWETCMTIGDQWSWKPNDRIKSAPEVIGILARCVGGDGNLLLDVGPMPDGRIEPRQADVLRQVGGWLNKYGESIYGTRGGPWKPGRNFASTRRGSTIYVHLLGGKSDDVILPDVPVNIQSASLLSGGAVKYTKQNGALTLTVPQEARDSGDTVVKLELADAAMDLPVMENSIDMPKATASNIYQNDADYGPAAAFDHDPATRWATDNGTSQGWIDAEFPTARTVGQVRISEAVAERVQKFEFQYRQGQEWKTAFSGTTLGKNFRKSFSPVVAREFRLNILEATDGPTISEIELLP